jgi:hypothetical protein
MILRSVSPPWSIMVQLGVCWLAGRVQGWQGALHCPLVVSRAGVLVCVCVYGHSTGHRSLVGFDFTGQAVESWLVHVTRLVQSDILSEGM